MGSLGTTAVYADWNLSVHGVDLFEITWPVRMNIHFHYLTYTCCSHIIIIICKYHIIYIYGSLYLLDY
jgi:hypothetical protein